MRRCGSTSSALAAAAALLLLFLVAGGGFHCAAAARLLPADDSSVPVNPALVHQAENGVRAAAAADGGLQVLQEGGAVGNGDELFSFPEMMGAAEAEAEACEEGNGGDEECMQRRLLHDAHLDYIYTQHKGKP